MYCRQRPGKGSNLSARKPFATVAAVAVVLGTLLHTSVLQTRRAEASKLVALGHHADDLVETLLLSIFFSGQIKSMPPKLLSDNGTQELVEVARGYQPDSLSEARDLLRWYIHRLRRKVEAEPSQPRYIVNVRGVGGGSGNEAGAPFGTVGGGAGNSASELYGTVAGGQENQAGGMAAAVDNALGCQDTVRTLGRRRTRPYQPQNDQRDRTMRCTVTDFP